jgi:hypothetical protein
MGTSFRFSLPSKSYKLIVSDFYLIINKGYLFIEITFERAKYI